ncbi:MAG: class II aldolase/adducin family protein [Sutterella sp.]|nr:class II aldolase/adducin family protein [Sutterella sp.]
MTIHAPQALLEELIAAAQALSALGLNVNKSGNVSARYDTGFFITPTGLAYELLTPEDLVWIPLHESVTEAQMQGQRRPSSEWAMHAAVYRQRTDVEAVVHTHSLYATALACQNMPIPAFHYMVAAAGGDSIEVVPYETFGTPQLAHAVANGLEDRDACLMEHHGVIAVGRTLRKAITLANEVENLAHKYVIVRQLGEPRLLDAAEMARIKEKFKTYGQPQMKDGTKHE